jgi:hypothetical protein
MRVVALLVAWLLWMPSLAALQASAPARRDLAADERCGGHTLARHVGRTDAELAERLRRQPDIAAASTYPDRQTAEIVVATAIARERARVATWERRSGRRPNLALRFRGEPGTPPIGRSLRRGRPRPEPCTDAVVVLRWDERRDGFCVLTSYPEVRR